MNELFHRAAAITEPISSRLLERIRARPIVMADETRTRMLDGGDGKPKNGFHWTFVAEDDVGAPDVGFVFAADRSGEMPRQILGGTQGTLLVDAYRMSARRRMWSACHAPRRRDAYRVDRQAVESWYAGMAPKTCFHEPAQRRTEGAMVTHTHHRVSVWNSRRV